MFGLLTVLALPALAFANKCLLECKAIEQAVSSASSVYYPGSPDYAIGIYHFSTSSQENSTCVVEPGTPEDLGKVLKLVGMTKTKFGVKSGGHSTNPGFSSTGGVLIYTGRFNQVTYDAASSTAVVGTGLIWDTVYERLQSYNVSVLGGRVTGIGVGGFLLGGGYSYKTNQHGLAIDTIVGYNLVLPNGTVRYVTESTYPDLFFGLKGGFNNFGIVTDFKMTTFAQTAVWGGQVMYPNTTFSQVRSAIADFSANSQDPKAAILPSYISYQGNELVTQGFFYDGPTPPPGTFGGFDNIPTASSDLKTRSYLDLILSAPANSSANLRGTFQMVGVTHFTATLLQAVESELQYWTAQLTPKSAALLGYAVEPFMPTYLTHATSPSAWPPEQARQPGKAPIPLLADFTWLDARFDKDFVAAAEESIKRLTVVAKAEGVLVDSPTALYGNYVDANTPLADIYGDNLPKLKALRAAIDPQNVMSLTGGFRF